MDNQEKIYYESEILRVLFGLSNIYYAKPWWRRWLYKPWFDALQTAAMILCGDKILAEVDTDEMHDEIEEFLS